MNENELRELLGTNGYTIIDEYEIIKDENVVEILNDINKWLEDESEKQEYFHNKHRTNNN